MSAFRNYKPSGWLGVLQVALRHATLPCCSDMQQVRDLQKAVAAAEKKEQRLKQVRSGWGVMKKISGV